MPKKLPILADPHPFLRTVSKPVEDFKDPKLAAFVEDMIHTMRTADGIGLAAPQVERGIRIIVVETKDGAIPFINPEITFRSDQTEAGEEGCLSVPKQYGYVKRSLNIKVRANTVNGELHEYEAKGLFARVIQHEIDHLNGVLFIDKLEEFTREELPEYTQPL